MTELDGVLAAAIHRGTVAEEARRLLAAAPTADSEERARQVLATCRRIGEELSVEAARLGALLADAELDGTVSDLPELPQRHELVIRLGRDDARRAVEVLESDGYRRHPRWSGGAERSFWATSTEVSLTRTAAWTTVVRLRWAPDSSGGRLARVFRPRPADWAMISLPGPAWWVYPAVRPVRLVLQRLGLLRRDRGAIEPFLATPAGLVEALLRFAVVDAEDVVADIGCGDGRIVVGASRLTGCRSIGVEYSPELVAAARREIERAGLEQRVRVVEGDGRTLDVSQVTVVLLFLPMAVAAPLVPDLLARLPDGARLVLHEQSPLDERFPPPATSAPIIGDDAITVAHLWRAENRRHEHAGNVSAP